MQALVVSIFLLCAAFYIWDSLDRSRRDVDGVFGSSVVAGAFIMLAILFSGLSG